MVFAELGFAIGIDAAVAFLFYKLCQNEKDGLRFLTEAAVIPNSTSAEKYCDTETGNSKNVILSGTLSMSTEAPKSTDHKEGVIALRKKVTEMGRLRNEATGKWTSQTRPLSHTAEFSDNALLKRTLKGWFPNSMWSNTDEITLPDVTSTPGFEHLYEVIQDEYIPRQKHSQETGGYIVEGIRFLEEAVFAGSTVTVCGRLYMKGGKMFISRPLGNSGLYLISTKTKEEIMQEYSTRISYASTLFKFSLLVGGLLVTAMLYQAAKRLFRRRKKK